MYPKRIVMVATCFGLILCFDSMAVRAQVFSGVSNSHPGTISGSGSVTLEKQPETMRMQIDLLAKSGSLKEAIELLKERKKSARQALEDLGAEVDSIEIGETSISNAQSEQMEQMREMIKMMQQRRGNRSTKKDENVSVPVTVTCALTADWKLSSESADELLLFVHPLQEEIKAADLSGAKDVNALSPEQQEMLEEFGNEYGRSQYYSSDESQPGDPTFQFLAKVSKEEKSQALKDAFQKAKAEATQLSQAAGMKLGSLSSMQSHQSSDEDYSGYEEQYYYTARMQAGLTSQEDSSQVVGYKLGTIRTKIEVLAQFHFKETSE